MWSDDKHIRSLAREIITAIGDHWGGDPRVAQVARTKYKDEEDFVTVFCRKIAAEIRVDVENGLLLWFSITRLLRDKIPFFAEEGLDNWVQIALVNSNLGLTDCVVHACST